MLDADLRNNWFIQLPIYDVEHIPFLVAMMTDEINRTNGILKTVQWSVSDKYLEYDLKVLIVSYKNYV